MSTTRLFSVFYIALATTLALLVQMVVPAPSGFAAEAKANATKILLLATPADHAYGTHMYREGCELMAKCLRQTSGVEAVVHTGWPSDPKMVEGVSAIAVYSAPGDFVLRGPHRQQFEKLMRQGVGFSAVHWGTGARPDRAEQYKSILGGYYTNKFGLNTTNTTVEQVALQHPICRGWKQFDLKDEIYLNPDLQPGTQAIAKVCVPKPPDTTPKDHTVVWAYERPDGGGKSFGCTLGHFHELFGIKAFRVLLTNGVLWTAGIQVPRGGAACELDAADLELPPDPKTVAQVKQFDANGDGDLDEAELNALVKNLVKQSSASPLYLHLFDKDKDGKLSADEQKQAYPQVREQFLRQCRLGKVPIGAASRE